MLLTVDVGNSQTVLATFDGGRRVGSWRVTTEARATADELRMVWRGLLRNTHITGVAACSTVPALLPSLRSLLDSLEVPVVLIGPGVRTGVPLHVDNPREVGADRVVTALAAHELFGRAPGGRARPVVVVDFGTSTNVDAVGPGGQFLGGALAPGVEVSLDALASRAAQLRSVELTCPPHAIGKNTVAALQSGLVLGFAGLVDGLVGRIAAELVDQFGSSPVRVSGGRSGWAARTCARVVVRPTSTGNGSTPASRSRSSLARRTRICSGSSSSDGPGGSSLTEGQPTGRADGDRRWNGMGTAAARTPGAARGR